MSNGIFKEWCTMRFGSNPLAASIMTVAVAILPGSGAADQLPLTMTVVLEESYDDAYSTEIYKVHVRLTNRHSRTISVANENLPWLGLNDERLLPRVLTLSKTPTVLERIERNPDAVEVTFQISPGEWLEGDIILSTAFPTLHQEIAQHGVRVEWRCEVRNTPVTCPAGDGGVFTIPKGKKR